MTVPFIYVDKGLDPHLFAGYFFVLAVGPSAVFTVGG